MKLDEEEIYGSLSDEITAIINSGGSIDDKIAAILSAADKDYDFDSKSEPTTMSGKDAAEHTIHRDDDFGEGRHHKRENSDGGKKTEAGDKDRNLDDIDVPDQDTDPDSEFDDDIRGDEDHLGSGKESRSKSGGSRTGDSRDTSGEHGNDSGDGTPDAEDLDNEPEEDWEEEWEKDDLDDGSESDDYGDIDGMNAQEAADLAKQIADAAQEAADAAQEAADTAQEKANQSKANADAAQEEANQAQEAANQAKAEADEARDNADNARETADKAQADANNGGDSNAAGEAEAEAEQAETQAEQAEAEADAAQETANQAQETANQAKVEAENDQQAANQAQAQADELQDDANSAKESANKAQEAADNGDDESARENAKDAAETAGKNSKNQRDKQGQNNPEKAQEAAEKAQDAADKAREQAEKAQDAADAAQDAADAAQDAADAAQDATQQGGDQDAADAAQDAANQAKESAEKAQDAANQAKESAEKAQDAANQAQEDADNGDVKSARENAKDARQNAKDAKNSANKAQEASNNAQDSAQEAADSTRDAADGADEDAAKEAQDKADTAEQTSQQNKNKGNNKQQSKQQGDKSNQQNKRQEDGGDDSEEQDNPQGNGGDDSKQQQKKGSSQDDSEQDDQEDSPSMPPKDVEPKPTMSDFDQGAAFGEFLAGLLYGFGGDPDLLLSEMHFDEVYELPDLPRLKVKDIHKMNFDESVHESLLESEEDVINDLRAALLDTNEKRRLSKILSALTRRKNGTPKEPAPEDTSSNSSPAQDMAENGTVDWTKVSIARADGDYDGTGALFGENHVMTDDMRSQIQDARSAKLKKTLFDKESPFSSEDGLLKTLTKITGRTFGKDGQAENEDKARKAIEPIKQRVRANRKGFIDWCHELRKFLKGIRMGFAKTDLRTRTIIDPTAPALFNRDRTEEAGNKIVIYLDVSGSVLGRAGVLAQVIAELKKIGRECKFKKMDIICFDQGILDNYCLIDQTPAEIQNPGWSINTPPGGGTTYDAVYKHMFKYYAMKKSTSAVLIFSDADALSSSNIFSNWAKKSANREAAMYIRKNIGKKCMFIGIDENQSRLPEFRVATIPGTKIILVSGDEFTQCMSNTSNESNNNTIMDKIYYKVNNLSEAFGKTRKPKVEAPAEEPAVEAPAAPVPPEDPEPPKEPVDDIDLKLDALEKQDIVRDNLNGGEIYEKTIDEWMQEVFRMWKLKKVVGTQNMLSETQTYCISLVNGLYKVNINNELTKKGGANGAAFTAQAITIPSKALLPGFMEAGKNIEIVSIRGNVKISNFTGEKLPPFFPKRIIGNMDGNGGNFYISNCPNLSSTENFPISLDGNVIIEGKINISDEAFEEYEAALQEFDAQRRAKAGLPPIENPEPKVTGNYIN